MRAVVNDPDLRRDAGDEPRSRAPDLVDDRLHLRGDLRRPGAAVHRAQRHQPDLPGRPGLRCRGHRRVLHHPADVRRWPGHRRRWPTSSQKYRRSSRDCVVRPAGQHAVHRAVPRPARAAATQAGAAGARSSSGRSCSTGRPAASGPSPASSCSSRSLLDPLGRRQRQARRTTRSGSPRSIIILSLGLLVRTSGQVSLCHAVFAAIGAVAFSQLAVDHGVPVAAGRAARGTGRRAGRSDRGDPGDPAVRPVPGAGDVRLRRSSSSSCFYARGFMFTVLARAAGDAAPVVRPVDGAYYYVVLAFVVARQPVDGRASPLAGSVGCCAGCPRRRSRWPRWACRPNTTRVIVFCVSAFFAGVGGILYGGRCNFARTADTHYSSFQSLVLLAVLALAPFAEPWYAVVRGHHRGDPRLSGPAPTPPYWLNALFGFFAIAGVAAGGSSRRCRRVCRPWSSGSRRPSRLRAPAGRRAWRRAGRPAAPASRSTTSASGSAVWSRSTSSSFTAPLGRITGLIGPNGAGKTTTFDACSGLNRRIGGTIRLHGRDVTRLGPAARGRPRARPHLPADATG